MEMKNLGKCQIHTLNIMYVLMQWHGMVGIVRTMAQLYFSNLKTW